MKQDDVTFEQVDELMEMLIGGELPEGMIMTEQPNLSRKQAFSVVWFLQEYLCVLPDHFEMCDVCGELFNAHHDGFIVDGTDVPSLWHDDNDVIQEMLEQHDGAKFCSASCEHDFWAAEKEKIL